MALFLLFHSMYITSEFGIVDSGCPVDVKRLKTTTMKRNEKKVPDFDEIIFENRNREYGAYDLRRRYKSAASFSILACAGLCALVFILISAFTPREEPGDPNGTINVIINTASLPDPNKVVVPPVKKPAFVPELNKYVAPIVSTDSLNFDTLMITDLAVGTVKDGIVTDTKDTVTYVPLEIDPDAVEIFITVEEDAMFPGGQRALLKFIADNTVYPAEAIANNVSGKVIVKFAVWSDGSVKRIEVLRKVDPLLDAEAMRVVSTIPAWKPGKMNGKPVPVWFSVPVTFQMINN
jgi:protein TonB